VRFLCLPRGTFPALAAIALVSCGHLGIDLEGSGGAGAASGSGGEPSSGGTAATSGGESGGGDGGGTATGGVPADGGASGSGGESASGGAAESGGAAGSGGSPGSGGEPGSGGSGPCEGHTSVDLSLMGWATEAGGTTGGKGGTTTTAWAGAQIIQALQNKDPQTPLTILIASDINPANTNDVKIDIVDVQDVSIIGEENRGVLNGIGLRILRAKNIVIRNLHIHHVDIGEGDAIGLAGPSDHIWVDHCELDADFEGSVAGTYDGLIDAKNDVAYVTYSWNHIHDTWDALLVGATETDTFDRKLTLHHNWIENIDSGAPSFRGGSGHVFNNLFQEIDTIAINTRIDACLRVENNVFENVRNPWASAYSTVLGGVDLVCNKVDSGSSFDFSSADISEATACEASVPYDYASVLTAAESVKSIVMDNVGIGKLADPEDF